VDEWIAGNDLQPERIELGKISGRIASWPEPNVPDAPSALRARLGRKSCSLISPILQYKSGLALGTLPGIVTEERKKPGFGETNPPHADNLFVAAI